MLKFDDISKNAPVTIYNKSVAVVPTDQDNIHNVGEIIPTEGDTIIPYIQQSEPLLLECKHFIESIKTGKKPLTDGIQGAKVVKILETIENSINSAGLPKEVRYD